MPIDREATLKSAEKFLRVGRLDAAIGEYARVLDEHPRDWATANTLGDLYLRAAQSDKAVGLYQRVADQLLAEGFYPKAAALLKKILKIRPEDEAAQIHLGDIAARQGLLVDARAYFGAVARRRGRRGDTAGVEEIVVRLGMLEGADTAARAAAAAALERGGDISRAARIYRALHDEAAEKGLQDDAAAALRGYARCASPPDRELLVPVVVLELREGRLDAARRLLPEAIASGPAAREGIMTLAWSLAETSTAAAAVCIDALADAWVRAGQFAEAAAILQEFTARVPGQVPALLRLVEVCVDGGLEATMYDAQAQLADAYLASGHPAEARIIAEDLVTREPAEPAHVERLRRALVLLNVPDIDAVIARKLEERSQPAGDAAVDLSALAEPPAAPDVQDPPAPAPLPPRAAEAVEPLQAQPPSGRDESFVEVDLTTLLMDFAPQPDAADAPGSSPPDLDQVFAGIRADAAGRSADGEDAADRLELGRAYVDMGMPDEAIAAFEAAARVPAQRFAAASSLAQLYRGRGDTSRAVEWYERAAGAPAPSAEERQALLYELADLLEAGGEGARALAVFMELDAGTPGYRDVAARVSRLSRVEAGG